MKLSYTKIGDYEIPNLILENNSNSKINKYGILKLNYLKEYDKPFYTTLLMKNELTNYLVSVSINAEDLLNNLMEDYRKSDKLLSEKNKKYNHIEWAKLMNNYKNCAEEVILNNLIYTKNV